MVNQPLNLPADVQHEINRQIEKWGEANAHIPDDRWIEILEDEFRDLKWAVRTCRESDNHTVAKERAQVMGVLMRWILAQR